MKKFLALCCLTSMGPMIAKEAEAPAPKRTAETIAGLFKEYGDKISAPVPVRNKILERYRAVLNNPDAKQLEDAFKDALKKSPGSVFELLIQIGSAASPNDRDTIIDAYLLATGLDPAMISGSAKKPVKTEERILPVARYKKEKKKKRDIVAVHKNALKTQMDATEALRGDEKYHRLIPPYLASKK